jgi:phosphate uptake regulator
MEPRKIQKVGHSTLTVSLPSEWVKDVGVKQGDTIVCISERDGSLKLLPMADSKSEKKAKEFIVDSDLCNEAGILERIVVGNYVLARDTIIIVSSNRISSAHIAEVRNATRRLMGLGIIEETPNRIVLQCSVDPAKFPIYTLIKRLYNITWTMHKEAMDALVNSDSILAKEVINREEEADRVYWLTVRLLLAAQQDRSIAEKIGIGNPLEIVGNRLVVKYLEAIADYAESIATNVLGIRKQVLERQAQEVKEPIVNILFYISELASTSCSKAMECFYTKDVKLANSAIKSKELVEVEEERLMDELISHVSDSHIAAHLRAIGWGLRRIAEYGASIAVIAINRSLEFSSKLCRSVP